MLSLHCSMCQIHLQLRHQEGPLPEEDYTHKMNMPDQKNEEVSLFIMDAIKAYYASENNDGKFYNCLKLSL